MKQKRLFSTIFFLLVIFLPLLPLMVTFNEVLTRFVESFQLYRGMQDVIVPFEVSLIKVLLTPFHIDFIAYRNGMNVQGTFLEMTWNCLGWQSLLLFGITLFVGLRSGVYSRISICEAILIGLLGTFLMNLFRLAFIVILFTVSRPLYAIVYHDYLAVVFTIIWLFVFWWFAFRFVLVDVHEETFSHKNP